MMERSKVFAPQEHRRIEKAVVEMLNLQPDFLSARTAESTRAVGDAIQSILSEHFQSLLGEHCAEYSAQFARRAMADLAFKDRDGFYHVVDVKTHRLGTQFNMPNLTSVERLARFYEDDHNYFVLLLVKYAVTDVQFRAEEAHFVPIEFLSWDCLTLGALGWGQVQIANANVIRVNEGYSRRKWMLQLCDALLEFYPREIGKVKERIEHFRRVKQMWESKDDD
ncbi:MAG: hypothetical protein NTX53_04625 [candidate division WOR-3 bacterium]|nr:hypothetical protein [candidate division WOR-3 bacterium]